MILQRLIACSTSEAATFAELTDGCKHFLVSTVKASCLHADCLL